MVHDTTSGNQSKQVAYQEFLETYRHHFDLTVKVIAVHVTLVGTLVGYLFQEHVDHRQRVALTAFVVGTALIPAIGSIYGCRWLRAFDESMRKLTAALQLPRFPVSGYFLIIKMTGVFNAILAVTGTVLLLLEMNR